MRAVSIPGGEAMNGAVDEALKPDPEDPNLPSVGSVIVYDCEIMKCIPSKGEERRADVLYCEGWGDHEGMGISLITVYDFATARYRIFMVDNLWQFARLCDYRSYVVGFNNKAFDDKLIATRNMHVGEKSVDILKVFIDAGGTRCKMNDLYLANFPDRTGKSGSGAMAPVLFQQGALGELIDYGMGDVQMTVELLFKMCAEGALICPKTNAEFQVRDLLPPDLIAAVMP